MRMSPGEPISGVVIRSLMMTARTRVEKFFVQVDGRPVEGGDLPGDGELILGSCRFVGVAGEPLLLWDGRATAASSDEVSAFFDGNVERCSPAVLETLDTMDVTPLDDVEFWSIIDVLERRSWGRTIARAERELAARGEAFVVRWSQAAALKALALADVLDVAGVPANDEPWVIGATIAQGRETFRRVLGDPAAFDSRWLADSSQWIPSLGIGAMHRLRDQNVAVKMTTAFSERQREIELRAAAETAAWQRENDIPVGDDDDDPSWFRVARTVVDLDSAFRERLVLLVGNDDRDADDLHLRREMESLGGVLVAGPEFSFDGRFRDLFNGEIFTIKRRSRLPAVEYVARHVSVPVLRVDPE